MADGIRLLLVNKPYGVLTQFTDRQGRATLADVVPFGSPITGLVDEVRRRGAGVAAQGGRRRP